MLRQRVFTALALAPLVMTGVLLLPTRWVALLLALVVLAGAGEWTRLAGLEGGGSRLGLLGTVALGLALLAWLLVAGGSPLPLLLAAALWWGWIAWRIPRITRIERIVGPDGLAASAALPVLLPAWVALVWIHGRPQGPGLLLFLLLLIWLADIAAYFAGRRFGRRKMAPVVSPGKTLEGALGALAWALVGGVGLAWLAGGSPWQAAALVLLCLVTVALSIIGDLYESLLKRSRGMKDSGQLLPGHGGVLDRVDSLTAAAPVFALGLLLLGGGS